MAIVTLLAGKERPVIQRHPWIFSGALKKGQTSTDRGAVIDVHTTDGEWLARGTWSSDSQIRVRLFTWDVDEALNETLLRRRIERACEARRLLPEAHNTNAYRLVYAESDGIPGLIVDRYGDYLVVQCLTQGMEARAEGVIKILAETLQPRGIYERSDADIRSKEGLQPTEGLRWGNLPPELLTIQDGDSSFYISLSEGQKTGFYLDQSINRRRVAAYCDGADVLDCFSYTGGLTIPAAQAGAAHITAIDSSQTALEMLRANLELNQLTIPIDTTTGDVFKLLRQYRDEGRQFDVVILDPPKFAHNQSQVERATRGYKDINLLAMQIVRRGGVLITFSCSGLISADLFQKIIFGATLDAQRDVQILERLTQAPDHPILLTFPEGAYLKGLICRVW
ncbi:MAG: class I SAM-dependent methyltransferase [Chloroflexota bacterium]